ncbi:MAG: DNA mismatch repair endonuclease MutL [Lachnospiraceae bacterium]
MGKIHLLDQNTINQIAAGEVVDRPVSVVKELTENAIDAGATAITIEIRNGGTEMIRVTDNGGGIDAEDLETAFKRHSTSKISDASDLLSVSSLGFRGEALSSIAAVSRVELITRTRRSLIGNRYVIEGGDQKVLEEAGAPEGTTILVRDLFFNTPARKKFLKTAATEGGYIFDMVGKMALSRPDISFRFIQNGQNKLHTSGNHNLKDVIYHIYGRELTRELLPIHYESSFFQIEGFIGKPLISRSTRGCEIYFINGRYIKSNLIHKAIEEGYRNFLMQHKFPFTVFNILIDPEFTDVNVHPAKMELRFRNQQYLYEEIVAAVRKTLTTTELSPVFSMETEEERRKSQKKPETVVQKAAEPEKSKEPEAVVQKAAEPVKAKEPKPVVQKTAESEKAKEPEAVMQKAADPGKSKEPEPVVKKTAESGRERGPEPFEKRRREQQIREEKAVYDQIRTEEMHQQHLFEDKLLEYDKAAEIRLVGQIFDTYWIAQYKDQFLIIDQHAAHEKVNYEKMIQKLKTQTFISQQQNPPAIISLTPRQRERIREMDGLLKQMGFEMESFGGNEYAVYAMPDNLTGIRPVDFLDELLEETAEKGQITPDAVYEKIASMACKASIKGNQKLSMAEAEHLIAELVTLENPYTCPHGRPTMIRMTRYELEKKFKRVL